METVTIDRLPVRKLSTNIEKQFRTCIPEKMYEKLIEHKDLFATINYSLRTEFRSPSINIKEERIYLHEYFVGGVWGISYLFLVTSEEIKKIIYKNEEETDEVKKSLIAQNQLIKEAEEFLDWFYGIQREPLPWPNQDIHPSADNDDERSKYIQKANGICIDAIVFCLLHEIGHFISVDPNEMSVVSSTEFHTVKNGLKREDESIIKEKKLTSLP